MINHISLSPFVFQKDFLKNRNEERAIDKFLYQSTNLDCIFLFIISSQKWWKLFKYFLENLEDDNLVKDIEEYMQYIDTQRRLFKLDDFNFEKDEESFLLQCENINFDYIIAKINNSQKILKPSNIIRKKFSCTYIKQGLIREFIEKVLYKILIYSEKIKYIDPYFNPVWGMDIINMFEEYSASMLNRNAIIEFHVRKYRDKHYNLNVSKWQQLINDSSHNIKVYIWDDRNSNYKMHDRYLITESIIINFGKGIEIHNIQEYFTSVNISVSSFKEAQETLLYYRENSSTMRLDKLIE